MDPLYGYFLYGVSLLTFGGLYAVMALGLNLQWGMTGILNVGIAGFYAIGAYISAILTTPQSDFHLGGYGMPVVVGLGAAMIGSAILAYLVGRICIRLRSDYLAIATIGIGEIFRLVFKVEVWATNGARGIAKVPRPFETWPEPWNQVAFMMMILLVVAIIYWMLQRAAESPWGRVTVAIRENEAATRAAGKDVERFRMQAFVIGSAVMGLSGALTAHYIKFIGPAATEPPATTFLVWVMLIAGGSGNNRGAILGAFVLWTIWSGTEIVAGILPSDWTTRISYIRVFLIGLLLQIVLQKFPGGLLPEKRVHSQGR